MEIEIKEWFEVTDMAKAGLPVLGHLNFGVYDCMQVTGHDPNKVLYCATITRKAADNIKDLLEKQRLVHDSAFKPDV